MGRSALLQIGIVAIGLAVLVLVLNYLNSERGGPGQSPARSGDMEVGMRAEVGHVLPTPAGVLTYPGSAEVGPDGEPTVRGAAAVRTIRCENPRLLRIETSGEAILATVPTMGQWDCGAALARWVAMAAPGESVGVEVVEGGGSIRLLSGQGSLNMVVSDIRRGAL